MDNGGVEATVDVMSSYFNGSVSDTSDTGNDGGESTVDPDLDGVDNDADPTNDPTTVFLKPVPITIEAVAEVFGVIDAVQGGFTSSVLASDLLNGAEATLSNVFILVDDENYNEDGLFTPGFHLDPNTGEIGVDAGVVPPGTYQIGYRICSVVDVNVCDGISETVVVGAPELTLTLTATSVSVESGSYPDLPDPGDEITYVMEITNTGDFPFLNLALSSDTLMGIDCDVRNIPVGESVICTADPYIITHEDINNGGVQVSASVLGLYGNGVFLDVSDTGNNGGSETTVDPDLDGINDDMDPTNDPTSVFLSPLPVAEDAISVIKQVNNASVKYGETVTYTLTYENVSLLDITGVTFFDDLPEGVAYTPGTARIDGVLTDPVINGGDLSWPSNTLLADTIIEVTLDARVVAKNAEVDLKNDAWALRNGVAISNVGSAVVRIEAEHIFHCSDVIGKVFDDSNANGIQDFIGKPRGLTDQTYTGGKIETAPAAESRGEPGLAGVRLSTVSGHLITTDAHGRFHVPCAALPADGGSNFTLKLDTRTLPTGYRMTTENPRVLRLTSGRFGRINFGATIAEVARIDLDAVAFNKDHETGEYVAIEALDLALRTMLNDASDPVSVVHLRYHRAKNETVADAGNKLDLVESILIDAWSGKRGTQIQVGREILRLKNQDR